MMVRDYQTPPGPSDIVTYTDTVFKSTSTTVSKSSKFQPARVSADGKAIERTSQPALATADVKAVSGSPFYNQQPLQQTKRPSPEERGRLSFPTATNIPNLLYSPPAYQMSSPTTHYSPTLMPYLASPAIPATLPISLHNVLDIPSSLHITYSTNSASECGILDEINDTDQEEKDILFWKLQELLNQEFEEIDEDIGRREIRDDGKMVHVTYSAEGMQLEFDKEVEDAWAEYKSTTPSTSEDTTPPTLSSNVDATGKPSFLPFSSLYMSIDNATFDKNDPSPKSPSLTSPSSSKYTSDENATFDDDDPSSSHSSIQPHENATFANDDSQSVRYHPYSNHMIEAPVYPLSKLYETSTTPSSDSLSYSSSDLSPYLPPNDDLPTIITLLRPPQNIGREHTAQINVMTAPGYTFINNFTLPPPTTAKVIPLSTADEENAVFDNNDPTQPGSTINTDDDISLFNGEHRSFVNFDRTSHLQPTSANEYKNFTFEDDDPSISSPYSSTDRDNDSYETSHDYESNEV